MRAFGAFAAMMVLGGAAMPLAGAHATIAIPDGTPVGTATDTLTLNGTYDQPLPTPLAQPFAAVPFTLTLTLPAEVSVASSAGEFILMVSGSYSNAGQTESFSGASSFATNSSFDALDLTTFGLLTSTDQLNLYTTNVPPLYRPVILASSLQSASDPLYQLATGTISNASGSATYSPFGDPNFSGTITVAASVPEPPSWAFLAAGVLALGAAGLGRRARRA